MPRTNYKQSDMQLTTADIRRILHRALKPLGMDICYAEDLPEGELTKERAAIAVSGSELGKVWADCIASISLCVPDLKNGTASLTRLGKLEKAALEIFSDGFADSYGVDNYLVSLQKHGIEKDAQMRCHYVSLKILFETLNVIN